MKRIFLDLAHFPAAYDIPAILLGVVLLANSAQAHPATKASSSSKSLRPRVPTVIVRDIRTGYFHEAFRKLQPNMAAHSDNADYEYRYAQSLLGIGKNHEALRSIKRAISEAPKKASYYRFMGQVYGALAQNANIFHAMGLAKDVLSSFRTAVKLDPQDPKSLLDLALYYIDAPGIVGGSLSKANKIENTLKKIDPLDALKIRAHEAIEAHHYGKAVVLLRQATMLDNTSQSARKLAFLYMRRHRYANEFETFLSITKQRPGDIRAWYWVGRASILSHSHYADGIHALQHYMAAPDRPDMAPSLAFAHLRLGDLYLSTGKSHLACVEYAEAKKSNGAHNREFNLDLGKSLRNLRNSNPHNVRAITSRAAFSKANCN